MKYTLLAACFVAFLSASCSSSAETNASTNSSDDNDDIDLSKRDQAVQDINGQLLKLTRRLDEELGEKGRCTASKYEDSSSLCFLENVPNKVAPHRFLAERKKVLIYDRGMTYLGLSMHRKRVVASYQFNPESGSLESYPYDFIQGISQFKIPRFYKIAHSDIVGNSPVSIPMKAFSQIYEDYSLKNYYRFDEYDPIESYNHFFNDGLGNLSLSYLADHIPDADFVLLNEEIMERFYLKPSKFCEIGKISREELTAHFKCKLEKVLSLVEEHDIDYILIPQFITSKIVTEQFKEECSSPLSSAEKDALRFLISAIANYQNKISELSSAVVFQPYPRFQDAGEHHTCKKIPNRIVVAATKGGRIFTDIPKQGSNNVVQYADSSSNLSCVDTHVHLARPRRGDDIVDQTVSFSHLEFNDKEDSFIPFAFRNRLAAAVALSNAVYRRDAENFDLAATKSKMKEAIVISPIQHFQTLACKKDRSYCNYNYNYYSRGKGDD